MAETLIPKPTTSPKPLKPMEEVESAVREYLQSIGTDMQDAQERLKRFLLEIQPDVELAVAAGDVMSLGYLRDRVMVQLARVSLGVLHKQREVISQITITVVRMLIRFAIAL